MSSIEKLLLLFSLLSNNSNFLINIVLKVWKYSIFLYNLMTLTKFLIVLTKENNCFYSFNQFIDDFLKFLILCRRTSWKTFIIKLKTINLVFEISINQKTFVIIWKSWNRNVRSRISDSISGDVSFVKVKKVDYV